MYCKKYFCTLNWLFILQASVLLDWLDIQSWFWLVLPLPWGYTKVLNTYVSLKHWRSPWGIGAVVTSIWSSVFWHTFWAIMRLGEDFMPLLWWGVQSHKMQYTNISSMVLSPPGDIAIRKEMTLNDLCYLPVSGNISLHNPQSFFPPYRVSSLQWV